MRQLTVLELGSAEATAYMPRARDGSREWVRFEVLQFWDLRPCGLSDEGFDSDWKFGALRAAQATSLRYERNGLNTSHLVRIFSYPTIIASTASIASPPLSLFLDTCTLHKPRILASRLQTNTAGHVLRASPTLLFAIYPHDPTHGLSRRYPRGDIPRHAWTDVLSR